MEKAKRKRNNRVVFRLSDSEYAHFKKMLEDSDLSCQDFFIRAINTSTLTVSKTTEQELSVLKSLNQELNKTEIILRNMDRNLLQIRAHILSKQHDFDLHEFQQFRKELLEMRKELNEKWQLIRSLINRENHIKH